MKERRGFTLIEVLIYLALMGLIFSGLYASACAVIANLGRSGTQFMVQEEGDFLLAKIEQAASTTTIMENAGGLEIDGQVLSNSSVRVENLTISVPDANGAQAVSFTLSASTDSGRKYSRDFFTIHEPQQ
jgi:prepilin-type N-terminal cleavage/methylation domain-containing protein